MFWSYQTRCQRQNPRDQAHQWKGANWWAQCTLSPLLPSLCQEKHTRLFTRFWGKTLVQDETVSPGRQGKAVERTLVIRRSKYELRSHYLLAVLEPSHFTEIRFPHLCNGDTKACYSYTVMCHLTTGTRSEKWVIRWFCSNIVKLTYTNLDCITYYIWLDGTTYCSWATNTYSIITILNTVGNCNTMVSMSVSKHRKGTVQMQYKM